MTRPFAHEASLRLDDGADPRGPGAAVTVALCGHWEHEGRCRWPHLSTVARLEGRALALRVVFVAEPAEEAEVRARIERGLRSGRVDGGPAPSGWAVLAAGPSELAADERALAEDLGAR